MVLYVFVDTGTAFIDLLFFEFVPRVIAACVLHACGVCACMHACVGVFRQGRLVSKLSRGRDCVNAVHRTWGLLG
jgi:hypothetical protein